MRSWGGIRSLITGSFSLMPLMISSVEAEPVLRIVISAGALAIDADDVGLWRESVAHVRDVADVDDGAIDGPDGQIVQLVDDRRRGIGLDRVLEFTDLHGAGGDDEILRVDGIDYVGGRQALGLQGMRIEVHLDLALLAAVGVWDGCALDGGELGADDVGAHVVELLFGEPLAARGRAAGRARWRRCTG